MRLGSDVADVVGCSFVSNFAQTEGFAVIVPGCADIRNSSFDENQLSCTTGSYRSDTKQVKWNDLWLNGIHVFFTRAVVKTSRS